MTDVLQRYKAIDYPIPTTQRSWFLYGVGLENLGKDGKTVEHAVPSPSADELLVRCDATGLCFSDIKIINQGGDHVRINRDIAKDPVIMGHESVVTVVQVGENLTDRFKVGERYVVQADIYVNGVGKAYGYMLPGALTQYETMGSDILNGDEGCYLIPITAKTGYAQAAITEPWACVVHSYVLQYRQHVKDGGVCFMIGGAGAETLELGATFAEHKPAKIIAAKLPAALLAAVKATGVEVIEHGCDGNCAGVDAIVQQYTDGKGFDDIIVCGKINDDCLEKLATKLTRAGVLNIVCSEAPGRSLQVDVGRIHYEDWYYIGTAGTNIGEAYGSHRAVTDLKADGSCLMLGAGGPMGQMHVQRACEMPNGPSLIVATDINEERLQELKDRFIPSAEANGRTLVVLNPNDYPSNDDFERALCELSSGCGFDDVVVCVPVKPIMEQGARFCGYNGLLNIFAGFVRGAECTLKLEDIYLRNVRWIGSSGSKISDMQETLRLAEAGELLTNNSVAAIGGLNAVYQGLELVKAQAVPGKIVIYQQIEDMPLMRLHELKDAMPTVAAKLRDGKYWTNEAEEELLRLKLALPEAVQA